MNLHLSRFALTPASTIGALSVDGAFECFLLEDRYRPPDEPKVFGETCIPCGTYRVEITNSPRFSELMGHPVDLPLLIAVPGFEGVRIHPGNSAADTEGCLLPGRIALPDAVGESRAAFEALFAKLKAAQKPIFITVALAATTTEVRP